MQKALNFDNSFNFIYFYFIYLFIYLFLRGLAHGPFSVIFLSFFLFFCYMSFFFFLLHAHVPAVGYSHIQSADHVAIFWCMIWNEDEGDDNAAAMEVHLGENLLDRAVLYASFHNDQRAPPLMLSWSQPGLRETSTCSAGQVFWAALSLKHL